MLFSYSGSTVVEEDRVIAMYHGTKLGNMVAVSSDPLLLNWEKVTDGAVISKYPGEDGKPLPYGVYDPNIWKKMGSITLFRLVSYQEGPGVSLLAPTGCFVPKTWPIGNIFIRLSRTISIRW